MKSKFTTRTLLTIILAVTIIFTGRKVYEYSADPTGEKDCPPLFPPGPTDVNTANTLDINDPAIDLPWVQKGGVINDASCLNRTPVYGIVRVETEDHIAATLQFASENGLKISPAGVRHSMGGHAFFANAVILDMRSFNKMTLDEANKILTVQSGATWHDIQSMLHPKYAVKAMQSSDIFSVGGSISVNAHGMDHQVGAVKRTIRSMRVMLPDGTIEQVGPTENVELFNLIVGGYGLFGIILDVELDITDNVIYESERHVIDYKTFPEMFAQTLVDDDRLGLMYGHLSTAPQSLLQEMLLYTYEEVPLAGEVVEIPPLMEVGSTKLRRLVLNFSKQGDIPMRVKWFAEKYIEPNMESCTVNRNQAMKDGEACLVSRNEPMHDSVTYLQNNLKNDTDILHEYFIPRDQFVSFIDGLRDIVERNDTNLLNASVRVVHPEDNFLNYAPTEMFSIVLYINQETTPTANEQMRKTTQEIIDLTLDHKGRFFLPYQLYYTPEQLERAYPMINAFFEAKAKYDPNNLLTNTFYEKYARSLGVLTE